MSEGSNLHREYVKPVKQIPAKAALFNQIFQVLVGCRDNSHIDFNRLCSSNPLDFTFLQNAEKFDLNFTLLADAEKEIANKYGGMKEKNMYGKKVMGVARTTFVIENGKIVKIFNNVKPEGHAEQVLEAL